MVERGGVDRVSGCEDPHSGARETRAAGANFVDFQAFLLEVVITEALRRRVHTMALIPDNGSTHAPKQLEHWLQERCRLHSWALSIQVFWLPANASWLNQIETWFSILQRKLLQPNHFASRQALGIAILAFIARRHQAAKPIQWTYPSEKLDKNSELTNARLYLVAFSTTQAGS
jgi:transposase